MKNVLLVIAGTLVSFAAGIGGMYLAMPTLAPEVVSAAKTRVDSLSAPADVPIHDASGPEAAGTEPRHLATAALLPEEASDSSQHQAHPDTSISASSSQITALQDSLSRLHEALVAARKEADQQQSRAETLSDRLANLTSTQAQAADLSKTLSKLEVRELRAILENLDMNVLEQLYVQASGRNRSRILKAMPSQDAARFVNRLVESASAHESSSE